MTTATGTYDPVALVRSRLQNVRQTGEGKWLACCPAHDDQNPSLSVSCGDNGAAMVHCFAGCTTRDIMAGLGLELRNMFTDGSPEDAPSAPRHSTNGSAAKDVKVVPSIEAFQRQLGHLHGGTWFYSPDFAVVRRNATATEKKACIPFHRVSNGWAMEKPGHPTPLLYADSFHNEPVIYGHEGEGCCDEGARLEFQPSTTWCGGSNAVHKTDWRPLAGRTLVFFADNDQAGEKAAKDIAAITSTLSPPARVKIVRLPGLPEGGDIIDYVAAHPQVGKAELRNQIMQIISDAPDVVPLVPAEVSQPVTKKDTWPESPSREAFHGPAGELVDVIGPETEADPMALLGSALTAFGNAAGTGIPGNRGPYFIADGARHYPNAFTVLMGATGKGRKGTSWSRIAEMMSELDPEWFARITSGMSSGEGLIWFVRDPVVEKKRVKGKNGEPDKVEFVTTDGGVADKRAMVVESEFASVLKVLSRDGNTLSPILRCAWETGTIKSMVKNSPNATTDAHISIIAHVTAEELREKLDSSEAMNGLGNRFLWFAVKRSKILPDGGCVPRHKMEPVAEKFRRAIHFARTCGQMTRDAEAKATWHAIYRDLSDEKPGLVGKLTGRAEAQVMRMAMIYALLDCSKVICQQHLEAALALWEYCEASVKWCFGNKIGNTTADTIVDALENAGEAGITRTEIWAIFGRNISAERLATALMTLETRKIARRGFVPPTDGKGRPAETWWKV